MAASAKENQTEPAALLENSASPNPVTLDARPWSLVVTRATTTALRRTGATSSSQGPRSASGRQRAVAGGPQSTHYIESRALKWFKQLEQIADFALEPLDDLPPDYDLAAKSLHGLLKHPSVSRRVELTDQIAMSGGARPIAAIR